MACIDLTKIALSQQMASNRGGKKAQYALQVFHYELLNKIELD